jgi:Icc-related predicted phosphoesterase
MRIVHGSDWHGFARTLDEADLYVFTGDMLDNYPVKDRDPGSYTYRSYTIDPKHEQEIQSKAIRQFISNGGFRRYLSSPDAPILVVRGNHDFVDLAPMFEGCNLIHEFIDNELVEVPGLGIKATGHRGIPFINGRWSDETERVRLYERAQRMPPADLYLTHYSPYEVLDREYGNGPNYGLEGMAELLLGKHERSFVHLFGHIHGAHGTRRIGNGLFSNAATTVKEFDFHPEPELP